MRAHSLDHHTEVTMIRLIALGLIMLSPAVRPALAAEHLQPSNMQRSYGAGVVTEGGRIVWLAGMGGTTKPDGTKITDIAEQTRQAFRNIEAALKKAGGTLENLVSMTVMIRNQVDG